MPLRKSSGRKAFSQNVAAEMDAGKPQKQALAIAYRVKRDAKRKGYADGGAPFGVLSSLEEADLPPSPVQKVANGVMRGVGQAVADAVMAPGRALNSTEPVTTEQLIKPAADMAGFVTLGAGAVPAEANALRVGASLPKSRSIFDTVGEKYPDVSISGSQRPGGYATLDKLVVPEAQRNQGVGTAVMRDIVAEADRAGVPLGLTPSADFGGNKARLVDFYRRFGFRPNSGRARDFETMSSMIRAPELPMDQASRMARAQEQGFSGPWYHGSNRIDRVVENGRIDPRRATSGPMPYFTENPEIASNYAKGKADTSLAATDTGDVSSYFTVAPSDIGWHGKRQIPVERTWNYLTPEQRAEILGRAKRVGYSDLEHAEGPLMLHPEGVNATNAGDHFDYLMQREHRNNPLAALRDLWHDSGRMVDDPSQLMEVYRLAGYPHAISDKGAPWVTAEGVLPAMLRMRQPLDTADTKTLQETVIPALERAFKGDRTRRQQFGADQWDKNTRWTPKEWVQQLKDDLSADRQGFGGQFVWTSIPDKVTNELRRLGFDGIVDTGGKMGGQGHRVAIPFGPDQVRSTFARFGKDDGGKDHLLKAGGGAVNPALKVARDIKRAKRADGGAVHVGPIRSSVAGRTDHHPMDVESGSYVLPADHVSSLGEGNTESGFAVLDNMFGEGGKRLTKSDKSAKGRRAEGGMVSENGDPVPIMAAGGEYVVSPAAIERRFGSLDAGHAALDQWVKANRENHIKTLSSLPGPAQS